MSEKELVNSVRDKVNILLAAKGYGEVVSFAVGKGSITEFRFSFNGSKANECSLTLEINLSEDESEIVYTFETEMFPHIVFRYHDSVEGGIGDQNLIKLVNNVDKFVENSTEAYVKYNKPLFKAGEILRQC